MCDYVDIYHLSNEFQINFSAIENIELVKPIFDAKKVPTHLISQIGSDSTRDFHRADFSAIIDTFRPDFEIFDFDYYVDFLESRCAELKSLWNE